MFPIVVDLFFSSSLDYGGIIAYVLVYFCCICTIFDFLSQILALAILLPLT